MRVVGRAEGGRLESGSVYRQQKLASGLYYEHYFSLTLIASYAGVYGHTVNSTVVRRQVIPKHSLPHQPDTSPRVTVAGLSPAP